QRHEALLGRPADDFVERRPILVTGRDVEETELVRTRRVVDARLLDRVAGVTQVDEVDALDDPSVLHVEAGNDPGLQHGGAAGSPLRSRRRAADGSTRPS